MDEILDTPELVDRLLAVLKPGRPQSGVALRKEAV
jgi:hypothetical protein